MIYFLLTTTFMIYLRGKPNHLNRLLRSALRYSHSSSLFWPPVGRDLTLQSRESLLEKQRLEDLSAQDLAPLLYLLRNHAGLILLKSATAPIAESQLSTVVRCFLRCVGHAEYSRPVNCIESRCMLNI